MLGLKFLELFLTVYNSLRASSPVKLSKAEIARDASANMRHASEASRAWPALVLSPGHTRLANFFVPSR